MRFIGQAKHFPFWFMEYTQIISYIVFWHRRDMIFLMSGTPDRRNLLVRALAGNVGRVVSHGGYEEMRPYDRTVMDMIGGAVTASIDGLVGIGYLSLPLSGFIHLLGIAPLGFGVLVLLNRERIGIMNIVSIKKHNEVVKRRRSQQPPTGH